MKRDASQHLREPDGNAERRRLNLLLRSAIGRGDYPRGRLPREWELMGAAGATRAVVRDALRELADAGVVSREPGLGTRTGVLPSIFGLRPFHGVDGVPEQSTYPRVTDRSVIRTPPVVAARIPECGPEVLRVEYIAVAQEFPGAVSTNYFVLPRADTLRDADFGHNIYAFLANGGIHLSASELLIGAAEADPYTARRLAMEPGAPVLTLEQIMYDEAGVAICFSTVAQRGDRVRYFAHNVSRRRAAQSRRSAGAVVVVAGRVLAS